MSWYQCFNFVEAALWGVVAAALVVAGLKHRQRRRSALLLGAGAFMLFGVTDLLETRYEAAIPLWLWGFKIVCGAGILFARYTWLGWSQFRWHHREVLFGCCCLLSVIVIITLQFWMPASH